MPTTSNFGWTTPADTDLVKDGAAAIRTLGNGIDTSLVDLKGGTTGQFLTKATNTNLDFSWVEPPTVKNYALLNTGGTALTGATTVTINSIGGYDDLLIIVDDGSSASANSFFSFRFNSDSGSVYGQPGFMAVNDTAYSSTTTLTSTGSYTATSFSFGRLAGDGLITEGSIRVSGAKSTTGFKVVSVAVGSQGTDGRSNIYNGIWRNTAAITSISLISSVGNWDGGTAYVFGA